MVVGVLSIDLLIPGCHSLKEKRHVLKKITESLRSRFNISIAEVGCGDLWQRALLACAAVNTLALGERFP